MKDREKKSGEEHEKQPLSRVIMENQDGTVSYLEGEDATKWSSAMKGLTTLGFVHGRQGQKELGSLHWKSAASLKDIPPTQEITE